LIRTWTVGAYIIEPCPDDPHSTLLYSYASIDPFGWLPDWFVTQFSPAALKDVIAKVSKASITEQTRRYGKGVKPDYDEIRRLASPAITTSTTSVGSSNQADISASARMSNGLRGGGEGSGMVSVAKPPEHLVGTTKSKKLYNRVLKFFKKQQRGEAVARPPKPSVKQEKKKSLLKIRAPGRQKKSKEKEKEGKKSPRVDFVAW